MDRSSFRHTLLLAAVALGYSTTVSLEDLTLLASPSHNVIYHFSGNPAAAFVPTIVDALLLAAVCFTVLLCTRGRTVSRIVWCFLLCTYPWIFARNCCWVLNAPLSHTSSGTILGLCGVAFILLAFGRRSRFLNRTYEHTQGMGRVMIAGAGIIGAVALVQVTFFGFEARHLNGEVIADTVRSQTDAVPPRRIVWLVLDELAYRQLYEHRLSGLQLPAFDRLRAESVVFSDVQPAGIRTEAVLPALMTGDPVDRIRATADGELTIHDAHGWNSFDQRKTIFADADTLGYRTSVVGWFNPYCRILPNVLDSCFWVDHAAATGNILDESVMANLVDRFKWTAERLRSFFARKPAVSPDDVTDAEAHIEDFVELKRTADAVLKDPRNNFVFLHMPVPHPHGIWDRRTSRFGFDHSSYVDNLVLADRYLAHVRRLLEANGQWDSTTLVIMGDHGWRTQLIWEHATGWSHEDELASEGGRFDPRPAYVVKLPYEHTAATIDSSFPAVGTRPLLDQLLLGRIANPAQLQKWVEGFESSPSTASRARPAAQAGAGDHS